MASGTIYSSGAPVWTSNWSASSNTAINTKLVDDITSLPKGTYLCILHVPLATNGTLLASFSGTNLSKRSNVYHYMASYTDHIEIIDVTANGGVIGVESQSSASETWSYTARGYLRALKLA